MVYRWAKFMFADSINDLCRKSLWGFFLLKLDELMTPLPSCMFQSEEKIKKDPKLSVEIKQ